MVISGIIAGVSTFTILALAHAPVDTEEDISIWGESSLFKISGRIFSILDMDMLPGRGDHDPRFDQFTIGADIPDISHPISKLRSHPISKFTAGSEPDGRGALGVCPISSAISLGGSG